MTTKTENNLKELNLTFRLVNDRKPGESLGFIFDENSNNVILIQPDSFHVMNSEIEITNNLIQYIKEIQITNI